MKKIKLVMAMAIMLGTMFAQDGYRIMESYQVGPGSHYTYYRNESIPLDIYVTSMDLSNPYIKLESVKSRDKLVGMETPSSMSKRSDRENHRIVSGINGDFYNTSNGIPISTHAVNGEYVHSPFGYRSGMAFSEEGKVDIFVPSFSGVVIADDDTSFHSLKGVNIDRSTNYLCIYNHFIGSTTSANPHGFECLATPISDWLINDTVYCVIESREYRIGKMAIPEGKFVLSGHGTADDFLDNFCQIGDTVRILQQQPSNLKQITQFVAGGPKILANGVEVVDESYPAEHIALSFCTTRHPRTAVGFNEDSTVAYFVVADGRKSTSVGIGLWDLADFMASIGAKNAVNLDGGGSSSFVVRNSVKNDPSDGGERSVANSFLCVSSAANGPIEHIQVVRDSVAVYKNKSVYTGITGWDEFYNPTGIPSWDSLTVTYDNTYGIFENNVFTANESVGNCVITADYQGDADSVLIHIIELYDLAIYPDTVTTDSVNDIKFEVVASNEVGSRRDYDNELFEFTVLDSNIASINKEGELIGKNNGETQVVVRYGTEYDTANVIIEIGSGEVVVDELETLTGWTLSSDLYIDAAQTSVTLVDRIAGSGTKALKVNYARTGDEDGNIYFETTPIDIFGVPSDILIDVLSDSIKHWIYVLLEDARGVEYSVKCASSLRYNDDYHTQYLDMANLLPADREQLYPIKITGIRLRIDDKATTGSLYVDRIRVIYPTWTSIDGDANTMIPTEHCLYQNYPNPFNPLTKISFEIAEAGNVSLDVYDISGDRITALVNAYRNAGFYSVEFSAEYLPTGVYFYRLQTGNWVDTKKMLIIK
jgi:hypothetical protein